MCKTTTRYLSVAAFIAYLSVLPVCYSVPITDPTGGQASTTTCHVDYQPAAATEECSSTRFYYNSQNNTCSMSQTACTKDFNVTYSTMDECELSCSDTTQNTTTNTTTQAPTTCTLPTINNGYALISCTDTEAHSCSVYYACNKPYELYPIEYRAKKIECNNGIWDSHEVYCTKMDVAVVINDNVSEDPLNSIVVNSGDKVAIGCRIDGMDSSKYNLTWAYNNDIIPEGDIVTDDNGVSQLVIASVSESHEGSYTCSVSGMIDQDIEVQLNVEDEAGPTHPKPSIIQFQAHITGNILAGYCACQGSPKPSIQWTVNGVTHTNEFPASSPDFTLSLLNLPGISVGTNGVTCECSNEHGTVSQTVQLEANGSKKKRSVTTLSTECKLEYNTVVVSGQILRTTDSFHHLKVNNIVLMPAEDSQLLDIQPNDVIRIAKIASDVLKLLRKNRQLTFKLTLTNNQNYSISEVLPVDSTYHHC